MGCYSSSNGLSKQGTWTYQTKGYCQQRCVDAGHTVEATSNKDECWCGDSLPPSSAKVDDSKCSSGCTGYGTEMCGGVGFFSVYTDGLDDDAVKGGSGSGTNSPTTSSTPKPKTSATTSATPSVVTIGGQTVVVTAPASASSTKATTEKSTSGGGPNKAAIAAGVVVGIVLIAAIAGGAFFLVRHRKRRAIEEEHRRNAAVSSFIGTGKPPTSSDGASSFTDTRLDPVMANRRFSDGSIADNQDYSRRILKVTNA